MEKDEIRKIYENYKAEIELATEEQKIPHSVINDFQKVTLPEKDLQDPRYLYQAKYIKEFDGGWVIELFVRSWDRDKTMQLRPDGNRISIFLNKEINIDNDSFTYFDKE